MTSELINEFLVLSEELNFSEAAELLSMTQATLSRHIIAMEKELDCKLFIRGTKGISLSKEGVLFLSYARSLDKLCGDCEHALTEYDRGNKGLLNIGATSSITSYYPEILSELLEKYAKDHSNVKFNISESGNSQLISSLKSGECDCVFLLENHITKKSDLMSFGCTSDNIAAILPADHKLAGKSHVSLYELKDEPFLLQPDDSPVRALILKTCAGSGFTPKILNINIIGPAMIHNIEKKRGVAFLMKRAAEKLSTPNVTTVDLDPPLNLYLDAFFRRKSGSYTRESFRRFIQKQSIEEV